MGTQLRDVLLRSPRKLPLAIAQACASHHFITYTRETVIPHLRAELQEAVGLSRAA